ncbi:hypothetical protein M7I_6818 [Glarea lozoyensis 74030]|uniref:KaiA N-terminal domain-containing protein n=1 Tax=Glarea lozoyensis (strain ATCC 74030 / MF5533) TaxID=1104152 RepID=H0EVL9_GLAL7|nr:hypothetical protein M7I_6818 [Glarea lozoyensis 74030]
MSSQEVPIPNGPERQRILNVLAQRRYRQRKRERLQSLEKRLDARLGSANTVYPSGRKVQLNHPIQTPLSVPSNPAATIDALQHSTKRPVNVKFHIPSRTSRS